MSRSDRLTKAAQTLARAQHEAMELMTNGDDPVAWDDETELHQRALVMAARVALDAASEDVLDALLGAPTKGWEKILEPRDLAKLIEDTRQSLLKVIHDYRYLQPGAFVRSKRETQERSRRSITGVAGDVADVVASTDQVRRRVRSAAFRVFRARQLVLGAEQSLNDASAIIDRAPVAKNEVILSIMDNTTKAEVEEARRMQAKTLARADDPNFDGELAG